MTWNSRPSTLGVTPCSKQVICHSKSYVFFLPLPFSLPHAFTTKYNEKRAKNFNHRFVIHQGGPPISFEWSSTIGSIKAFSRQDALSACARVCKGNFNNNPIVHFRTLTMSRNGHFVFMHTLIINKLSPWHKFCTLLRTKKHSFAIRRLKD